MRYAFKRYLLDSGYKEYTDSGAPSTVYDYIKRIDRVCEWEKCDWYGLSEMVHALIPEYDFGGRKEHYGSISHRSVINALKRFAEFIRHRNAAMNQPAETRDGKARELVF